MTGMQGKGTVLDHKAALENLTVLDLTRVIAGPYCSMMLADMGAEVIKVEIPGRGDDSRAYGPHVNGESVYFANLNRNKLGITLNLKHPTGKALFLDLARQVDILIENFRPGVMDKLGLGYDVLREVNDQLIYAAVSGFGSYGPYSQRPGYDLISQAMGGVMSITGHKGSVPLRAGNALGDVLGGMNLTIGVLAAVNARHVIGHGQRVDIALVDSVVASLENAFVRYYESCTLPERNGNAYASLAPCDSYEAKDGYVVIACGNQKLYEVFCNQVLQMPELVTDQRFITVQDRVKNIDALTALIESWTKQFTVDKIVEFALERGVPASPIYNLKQILEDEHIAQSREMFVEIEHPTIGKITVNGNPIKLLDTMPQISKPAPRLGEHNQLIFGEMLGRSAEELAAYKEDGII
jgi:crotonobetainyl-CoA:carnitine CoA-transferase CaiB-like acyl-CoA transferase